MNPLHQLDLRVKTRPILLFVISWVFVAVISCWNSILTPFYCADSCVFSVMADGWMHGLVPYKDMFDHKGPFVYLVYSAANLDNNGRFFLTLVQALFMTANACLIYRIGRLFVSPAASWICVLASYVLVAACGDSSFTTEEISLPFSLLPLYLSLSQGLKTDWKASRLPAYIPLVCGICLGIHFLVRMNNAVTVCSILGVYAILVFKDWRTYHSLSLRLITCVLGGFLLPTLPFIIYFAVHNAWHDYIYANFLFNFRYAQDGSYENLLTQTGRCIFLLPLIIFGCINIRTKIISHFTYFFILFLAVCSFLASSMGWGYMHYTLLALPAYVLSIALTLKLAKFGRGRQVLHRLFWIAMVLLPMAPFCRLAARHAKLGAQAAICAGDVSSKAYGQYANRKAILDLTKRIPESEKKGLLAINGFGEVYRYLDIQPPFKYFMLQDMLSGMTKGEIGKEVSGYISQALPKWVCVKGEPQEFECALAGQYRIIGKQGDYSLYMRIPHTGQPQ